jgi:hypothetical protein
MSDVVVGLAYTAIGVVLLAVNIGLFYMAFIEKPLTEAIRADKFWSRWILIFEVIVYVYSIWKGWI